MKRLRERIGRFLCVWWCREFHHKERLYFEYEDCSFESDLHCPKCSTGLPRALVRTIDMAPLELPPPKPKGNEYVLPSLMMITELRADLDRIFRRWEENVDTILRRHRR